MASGSPYWYGVLAAGLLLLVSAHRVARESSTHLRGPFISSKQVLLFVVLEALAILSICLGQQNIPWGALHTRWLQRGAMIAGVVGLIAFGCTVVLDIGGAIARRRR